MSLLMVFPPVLVSLVIARSKATKQSISPLCDPVLDLRGACHRARICDPLARNDGLAALPVHTLRPLADLIIKHRRWNEAAEFTLDQFGQPQRRTVFQPWADDLHADRQALRRKSNRDRGGRQAG